MDITTFNHDIFEGGTLPVEDPLHGHTPSIFSAEMSVAPINGRYQLIPTRLRYNGSTALVEHCKWLKKAHRDWWS